MQLSLSGRIAEEEARKDHASLTFEQLARMAAAIGYRALCLRPTQATLATPDEQLCTMRALLDSLGLQVSMASLATSVAANSSDAGKSLADLERALDVATLLGAPLIRVGMKSDSEIAAAQRAADQAAERGIKLAHQTHTDSPFETVESSLATLQAINRPNFGLVVEPANLLLVGDDYGASALIKIAPYIFNVYVQNVRVDPAAPLQIKTRSGIVHYDRLMVGEEGGVDFDNFFAGLKAAGYNGFVTSHQPAMPGIEVTNLATAVYRYLNGFLV